MPPRRTAPLVSVLLPTYRRPKLLPRAIRSVLAQTFQDWELLVVDDASGDRTWQVMRAWAKKDLRIRIIRQAHGGGFRAYATAYRRARGKYIALLNDDDAYLPRHLERRVEYFRRHPAVDFVFGLVYLVGPRSAWYVPDALKPGKLIHLNRCHNGITYFMNRRGANVAFSAARHHHVGDLSIVQDCRRVGLTVRRLTREYHRTVVYYRNHASSVTHRWRRQLGV
ncbi:MAG: glycosyltransferase family 2 protein [bacterium]|nr:glycosyltransferase family 2 protein [bacterium]